MNRVINDIDDETLICKNKWSDKDTVNNSFIQVKRICDTILNTRYKSLVLD